MHLRLAQRLLRETDPRLLWKLAWDFGFKSVRSVRRHRRRLRRGEFFPPFLYVSVTNRCSLQCQGCWVDVNAAPQDLEAAALHRLIRESTAMGTSFFGIVGGEPFMHPELFDVLEQYPNAYFQVFTNGHCITEESARRMRRLGNVTPLISVEGNEIVSDQRRRGKDVWRRTMEGLQRCLDQRLITGVCTSVCRTNIDDLLTEDWIDRLIEMGVLYVWFYIYRPVGPNASPELCLSAQQQQQVRRFVVETRVTKPILVVDAYHDGAGRALCPSATGFAHHVNPWGDIEPCPVIQLAKESIHEDRPLREIFNQSQFLRDYRAMAASVTQGCVVLERPDVLEQLARKHNARDATARGTVMAELAAMRPRPSQYSPGAEIPEKSWLYRLAKRLCFTDFGAYQEHFRPENWRDPRAQTASGPEQAGAGRHREGPAPEPTSRMTKE